MKICDVVTDDGKGLGTKYSYIHIQVGKLIHWHVDPIKGHVTTIYHTTQILLTFLILHILTLTHGCSEDQLLINIVF